MFGGGELQGTMYVLESKLMELKTMTISVFPHLP